MTAPLDEHENETPGERDVAASIRQRKLRRKRTITIVIVAAVVMLGTLLAIYIVRSRAQSPLQDIITAKVTRADIIQKISATGNVDAQTGAQVNIGSQVTGRIKKLYVDIGNHVKAGQIIAILDLPDVEAQLNQARAGLSAAEQALAQQISGVSLQQTTTTTDISKAEATLATAQATYRQDAETRSAQIAAAQAAVNQAMATYRNAETFLSREQRLLTQGYVARQDVDKAQAQANVAAAQLDSARQNAQLVITRTAAVLQTDEATVKSAQAALVAARAGTAQNTIKGQQVAAARAAVKQAAANVSYWQAQLAKTVIRTPVSGTVVTLSAQTGETVAAGLSAPTLVTVVDLKRLQVDAYVDETDIGNVHIGQPASVTVDAYPNMAFTGVVTKIASAGTLQQNVVTYDTTIALVNPRGLLKPAMTATVTIVVGEHRNVVVVPIEAVKYVGTMQVVYVVQGKQIVVRPVVVGVSDDVHTEILRGVQPGETIVRAGYPPSGGSTRSIFGPGGGGGGGRTGGGGGGGAAGAGGGGGRGAGR